MPTGTGYDRDNLTPSQQAELDRRIRVDSTEYNTFDEYMEDVRTRKHLSHY